MTMDTAYYGSRPPGGVIVLIAVLLMARVVTACGDGSSVGGGAGVGDGAVVLYSADDGATGTELWRSDGTVAGTYQLADLYPGLGDLSIPRSSDPTGFTVFNGEVYFAAKAEPYGRELWKSDGTAAGTVVVKNIADAPFDFTGSFPEHLVVHGDALYFSAYNLAAGTELWRSDGTDTGTVRIKDINAAGDSYPMDLVSANGLLWFTAHDDAAGRELWVSDGTGAGTSRIKDVESAFDGAQSGRPIVPLNDGVFYTFSSSDFGAEPGFSDGTAGNTGLIEELWNASSSGNPGNPVSLGDRVLFSGTDGGAVVGYELFSTDGSTVVPIDINPGTGGSYPYGLMAHGGRVYFGANNVTHGTELWVSDGTVGGTQRLEDLNPGNGDGYPDLLAGVGADLYFGAYTDDGYWLFRTDGTVNGAQPIAKLSGGFTCSKFVGIADGRLLFGVDSDSNNAAELWVSDGTAGGTIQLSPATLFPCD